MITLQLFCYLYSCLSFICMLIVYLAFILFFQNIPILLYIWPVVDIILTASTLFPTLIDNAGYTSCTVFSNVNCKLLHLSHITVAINTILNMGIFFFFGFQKQTNDDCKYCEYCDSCMFIFFITGMRTVAFYFYFFCVSICRNRFQENQILLDYLKELENERIITAKTCEEQPLLPSLVTVGVTKIYYDQTECAICKEDLLNKHRVVQLCCNHVFHIQCLSMWIESLHFAARCPCCLEKIEGKNKEVK